jgi:hypothetical protein
MVLLAPARSRAHREQDATPSRASAREQPRVRWVLELGLLALLYAGYLTARALMGVHVDQAQQRGQRLLDLEALAHLDVERPLNAVVTAVPALGLTFAYLYATLHYLVTPAVLVWLAVRRREVYRTARTALLAATAIGLVGYWLLPTAPPRLLGAGFSDTMAAFSGVGWWGQAASAPRGMEALSNQYAALPSLHVGWAVWVALCLGRHSNSRLVRRWVWIYPALMTVVVMGTANHYLADALAGAACAFLGDWLARWLQERQSNRSRRYVVLVHEHHPHVVTPVVTRIRATGAVPTLGALPRSGPDASDPAKPQTAGNAQLRARPAHPLRPGTALLMPSLRLVARGRRLGR